MWNSQIFCATMLERPYEPHDLPAVMGIYTSSIHTLAALYYSPEQLIAWAPFPPTKLAGANASPPCTPSSPRSTASSPASLPTPTPATSTSFSLIQNSHAAASPATSANASNPPCSPSAPQPSPPTSA